MQSTRITQPSHSLLWWIVAGYLAIDLTYALLIPAWEANDEIDHIANIEYVLQHRALVPLRLQTWHETHQPPLYYFLAAAWQRTLGVEPFTPMEPTRTTGPMTAPTLQLAYVHPNKEPERTAAIAVRKIRLFSTLVGLATVVLTYCIGLELGESTAVAASAAAFVGFLPKFNVISAAATNDSLVVMLCSLGLFLALRCQKEISGRILTPCLLGIVAGGAVMTKLNSVPVVCFLVGSVLLTPGKSLAKRARTFGVAVAGGVASTGWWLLANYFAGRGWLGQKGVAAWLSERLPGLISKVSWTDQERFLNFVPTQLFQTIWYNGGWNQFVLPFAFNLVLAIAAAICSYSALAAFFQRDRSSRRFNLGLALSMGCCLMALAAVLIIARTTTQAEGRIAYPGLSAFAVVVAIGAARIFPGRERIALLLWPALLLPLNVYVFARFIMPFAAL